MTLDNIKVINAEEHNLKNISVEIPRYKLTVITGLSGSGKSSLVFDTLFAEGQRRYIESFSLYVRQFIGDLKHPKVEKIEGLSPVIAIDQKTLTNNPRSTVGTITEIYGLLRLLYAKISVPHSPVTGKPLQKLSVEEITQVIKRRFAGKSIAIMAPVVKSRKGFHHQIFMDALKKGYTKAFIDGKLRTITINTRLERYKIHDIDIVIDRMTVSPTQTERLLKSLKTALRYKKQPTLKILDLETFETFIFSTKYIDIENNISFDDPQPNTFSFNSPYGMCPVCQGRGSVEVIDWENIVEKLGMTNSTVAQIFDSNNFALEVKILMRDKRVFMAYLEDFYEELLDKKFYELSEDEKNLIGALYTRFLQDNYGQRAFNTLRKPCSRCKGYRLNEKALAFKITGYHIGELATMSISELYSFLKELPVHLNHAERAIAEEILKETLTRIEFLLDVGLEYLHLNRDATTLSGGESQRIRLATQIGIQLTDVLYILDEPSIGLHPKDHHKLIKSLKELRDMGNTVIVVEHDKDTMLNADYLIDIGPGAGRFGGHIINEGTLEEFLQGEGITAQYLKNERRIEVPKKRIPVNPDRKLILKGARGNNLKNITAEFPLGLFICVTGVSGSGKSTLINRTLFPLLHRHIYSRSIRLPLEHDEILGLEHIDKIIRIDQKPIGRNSRSNPATYTKVFNKIRDFFAKLPEARARGYKPGRFSFNVSGGRCEECQGSGVKTIQMGFLPDVYVDCPVCRGKRYNRETLEVRYKGKSISDVLNMTFLEAYEFFEKHPSIRKHLNIINKVGLGYLRLGQPAPTLSGGEAQRVKIATELAKKNTGKTVYILDEPTTGLHFEDIKKLIEIIRELIKGGNTVIIIEHNLDVIKSADWLIELGPGAGEKGGEIIAAGTPEDLAAMPHSPTGMFLKQELYEEIRQ